MSYYRSVRTTQERRRSMDRFDDEIHEYGLLKFRCSRNDKNLVNSYDDVPTSSIDDRSWKRQTNRKKQWKPKPPPRNKKHSKFRGHPTWVYPVFTLKKVWKKDSWYPGGYWIWVDDEFIGYKITTHRWYRPRLVNDKRKLYTEEEVRNRGFHIR